MRDDPSKERPSRQDASFQKYCRDSSRKHSRMAGGAQEVCPLGTRRTRGRIASWIGVKCPQRPRGSIAKRCFLEWDNSHSSVRCPHSYFAILIRPQESNPSSACAADSSKTQSRSPCVPLHTRLPQLEPPQSQPQSQPRGRGRGAVDYKLAE